MLFCFCVFFIFPAEWYRYKNTFTNFSYSEELFSKIKATSHGVLHMKMISLDYTEWWKYGYLTRQFNAGAIDF